MTYRSGGVLKGEVTGGKEALPDLSVWCLSSQDEVELFPEPTPQHSLSESEGGTVGVNKVQRPSSPWSAGVYPAKCQAHGCLVLQLSGILYCWGLERG